MTRKFETDSSSKAKKTFVEILSLLSRSSGTRFQKKKKEHKQVAQLVQATGSSRITHTETLSFHNCMEQTLIQPHIRLCRRKVNGFVRRKNERLDGSCLQFRVGTESESNSKPYQYKMDPETLLSLALNETNSSTTEPEKVCSFQEIGLPLDYQALLRNSWCLKHSASFTALLCVLNSFIFIFGVGGNILIIYVVAFKTSNRTASSLFILNLAAADLFVVVFCVPSTLLANVFRPWVLGKVLCKGVSYAQGVFVIISVYSLVAISFDRFRAVYWPFGVARGLTSAEACKVIGAIWAAGLIISVPWMFVFRVVEHPIGENRSFEIPVCTETWPSKSQEIGYYIVVHMFLSYLFPFFVIAICNVHIWRNVIISQDVVNSAMTKRTYYLKVFTTLTILFFILWLPLYVIMTRVKLFYTVTFHGGPNEVYAMSVLIPLSQLLGSCNSCVNPVLYAVLNQTFRETLKRTFGYKSCSKQLSPKNVFVLTNRRNDIPNRRCSRIPIPRVAETAL